MQREDLVPRLEDFGVFDEHTATSCSTFWSLTLRCLVRNLCDVPQQMTADQVQEVADESERDLLFVLLSKVLAEG